MVEVKFAERCSPSTMITSPDESRTLLSVFWMKMVISWLAVSYGTLEKSPINSQPVSEFATIAFRDSVASLAN